MKKRKIAHRDSGGKYHVFIFYEEQVVKLYRVFGRYASDQNMSFSWMDAAQLSTAVRTLLYKDK